MSVDHLEIIDDFLKKEDFLIIKNQLLGSNFDWYYNEKVVAESKEKSDFQFTHILYNDYAPRKTIIIVKPILDKLNPLSLLRIKCNLLPRANKIIEHGFHVDYDLNVNNLYTAIYYVNTCNGYTKFKNGKKVKSIENRIVIFKSNLEHTGTTCTDEQVRVVINFNFINDNEKKKSNS